MKRYEMIAFSPEWGKPIEEIMRLNAEDFVGLDNYTSAIGYFQREQDIYMALEMVAAAHLQLPGVQEAGPWIQKGFDCALHYFLDDWRTDEDPKGRNMVAAKRRHVSRVGWYRGYSRGLILGLLSERWDDVARFSSWPWVGLVPEYSGMGSDLEDEVALMYIIISAGLREEPLEKLDKLKAKILKCRTKRPRLLMKLWESVEGGDQKAFAEALIQSLRHHASGKRLENRDARMAERLALPQTAIYLTALHRGLHRPELPEDLSVYVITRGSLGLGS